MLRDFQNQEYRFTIQVSDKVDRKTIRCGGTTLAIAKPYAFHTNATSLMYAFFTKHLVND